MQVTSSNTVPGRDPGVRASGSDARLEHARKPLWTPDHVRGLLIGGAASLLTACTGPTTPNTATLYTNATILTMDGTTASQMRVEDGRIAAIGADLSRDGAAVIDLGGAAVIPGVVDSHVHVRELGMDAIKVDLVGVESVADIVTRIRDQRADVAPGAWIIGQGWDEGRFADLGEASTGGYPTTEALSQAFPDNPVALESLHGFGAIGNARAFERAGITDDTPDPEGGTILRGPDGRATGVLLTLAQGLLFDVVPDPDSTQVEAAIKAGLSEMARAGVTSVHEAGMSADDVAAFQALTARGELPIRVFGLLNGNDAALMSDWFARGPLLDDQDRLEIGGIKVFYDGSLGSRTAVLNAPYSDQPDAARPNVRISYEDVTSLAERATEHGFQMAVHAIGDGANDDTMDIFEAHARGDHRWRIEHAQVVSPSFTARAAALQVIASMQPSHAMGDSAWAEDRVGAERIRRAYAWKTFTDAGVPVIFNSDLPGEPWTPMETLHFAATRTKLDGTPDGGWYANEALSREDSLRAMTVGSAAAAFQDDTLGSLSVGKWADFVVLSDNPLTAPDIRAVKVKATYVAGERVSE